MALILFGGFEMGSINGEFSSSASPVVIPHEGNGTVGTLAGGRSGAYQARVCRNTNADWVDRLSFMFPSALSEFFWQVALASEFLSTYSGQDRVILRWINSSTGNVMGGIKYKISSNVMEVYIGDFATLVGTFPAPIGDSTYWVFELHLVVGDSGLIEIRRDMTPVFSFSGDTKPGADTAVDCFEVACINAGMGDGTYHYVDDFVLNDPSGDTMNGWPGGLRIACLIPNTDDGLNEWTPSTAVAHYSTIDELPPSAVDYLQTGITGKVERMGLSNLPDDALIIQAVKILAQARKDSDAEPTKLAVGVTIGGVDYYSSDLSLLIASGVVANQWLLSPASEVAFTPAEVNGMKLLLKSAA